MGSHRRYDLVVLGSGPAGESAAQLAANAGYRTAIVERLRSPGGVVVANGGVPTKTLRETAMYLTGFMDRRTYGVGLALQPEMLAERLATRTEEVCGTIASLIRENLAARGIDLIHGTGRLGPDQTVTITPGEPDMSPYTIQGRTILIATGSRPAHPPFVPAHDPDIWDNESILTSRRIPSSLLIIGGGAIGCEYGSIYNALGSQVTIVDIASQLLPFLDYEMSQRAAETYRRAGVRLILEARVQTVGRVNSQLVVRLADGTTLEPDGILVAAGREVNTEGLGLREAGVAVDARGRIVVDEQFGTTAPGIFAAGDVISPTLASVSMEQGRVAISHALDIDFKLRIASVPVIGVYSMPEIAMAGLTEQAAASQGIDYEVGRCDFTRVPRAHISGHTDGLLKLVFERSTKRLLGVHALCDVASEIVPLGQEIISRGETIERFVDLTLAVPTYTLAYKLAAFDGLARLARSAVETGPPEQRMVASERAASR